MARVRGRGRALALPFVGLACAGCPSAPKEGPPPAESLEIAVAAPHALGALAGGTEAAPRAVVGSGGPSRPGPEDAPDSDDDEGDAGVAPAPDAGSGGPEDVPL
jgi:hypothetical protein